MSHPPSVSLSAEQDRRNGEVVAVKIVPKGRLRPDQLERIRREYSIMNQVSHKNLISLIEVIENPHEICIVMEYASDGYVPPHPG